MGFHCIEVILHISGNKLQSLHQCIVIRQVDNFYHVLKTDVHHDLSVKSKMNTDFLMKVKTAKSNFQI